jgi:hypothetical protein
MQHAPPLLHDSTLSTPQILVHQFQPCGFGSQHAASGNSASKLSISPSGDRLCGAERTGIFLVNRCRVVTNSGTPAHRNLISQTLSTPGESFQPRNRPTQPGGIQHVIVRYQQIRDFDHLSRGTSARYKFFSRTGRFLLFSCAINLIKSWSTVLLAAPRTFVRQCTTSQSSECTSTSIPSGRDSTLRTFR